MGHKKFDLEEAKRIIREISGLMKEFGLAEVEIVDGEKKVVLKRQFISGPSVVGSTVQSTVESKNSNKDLETIKSPMIGTFYRGLKKPDSEPFIEVGSNVTPQTPVCIIETMKLLNEIQAKATGEIVEILVENGQAVGFGQILFKVRPS